MKTILILTFLSFGAYAEQGSYGEQYHETKVKLVDELINQLIKSSPEIQLLKNELNKAQEEYDTAEQIYNEAKDKEVELWDECEAARIENDNAEDEYKRIVYDRVDDEEDLQDLRGDEEFEQIVDKTYETWVKYSDVQFEYDEALDELEKAKGRFAKATYELKKTKGNLNKAKEELIGELVEQSPELQFLRDRLNEIKNE